MKFALMGGEVSTDSNRLLWYPWHGLLLFLILAAAVILRIAHFASGLNDPYLHFRVGDEQYYHEWALQIAQGQLARGSSFFTAPLYAYFLGTIYSLGVQDIAFVRLLNVLLGIGATYLIFCIARNMLTQGTALLAPLIFALCAVPLFYESFPEKTTLVIFLTALSFFLMSRAIDGEELVPWLWSGIAAGLASLAHTLLLVFVPAVGLHLFLGLANKKFALKAFLAFCVGVLLTLSPATIHNYLQDSDFVLVSSNGGQNFYAGNHSGNLTGKYTSPPFSVANIRFEEENYKKEAERRTGKKLLPSEVSRYWYRQGVVEMLDQPILSLIRLWRKFRWSIGQEEVTDSRTFDFYRERMPVLRFPLVRFGGVAFLGILGCIMAFQDKRFLIFSAFLLFFCLGISLHFVYGRYRLPLLIPLSILSALALSQFVALVRQRRRHMLAIVLFAALPTAWLVFGRVLPSSQVSFFPDYYNQGNRYYNLGMFDLAIAEYEKALSVRPGDHPGVQGLIIGLADLYVSLGNAHKAEALLRRALADNPGNFVLEQKLWAVLQMR